MRSGGGVGCGFCPVRHHHSDMCQESERRADPIYLPIIAVTLDKASDGCVWGWPSTRSNLKSINQLGCIGPDLCIGSGRQGSVGGILRKASVILY